MDQCDFLLQLISHQLPLLVQLETECEEYHLQLEWGRADGFFGHRSRFGYEVLVVEPFRGKDTALWSLHRRNGKVCAAQPRIMLRKVLTDWPLACIVSASTYTAQYMWLDAPHLHTVMRGPYVQHKLYCLAQWQLAYLCLALGCDMPILEALWVHRPQGCNVLMCRVVALLLAHNFSWANDQSLLCNMQCAIFKAYFKDDTFRFGKTAFSYENQRTYRDGVQLEEKAWFEALSSNLSKLFEL